MHERQRDVSRADSLKDDKAPGKDDKGLGKDDKAPRRRVRVISPLLEFLSTEAGGGALLLAATVAALVWANSPLSDSYGNVWHTKLTVGSGPLAISEDLQHWVNDALMAIFFFLIGLEIKRELAVGELRDPQAAALPALAALGGMVVPALLYLAIAGTGRLSSGWGIPMATDIAFVLGVLAVLGRRAPTGLKIFLLTLAIIDDIGAIAVIALFYSGGIDLMWLAGAVAALLIVVPLRPRAHRILFYVPIGIVAWYCTFKAGIHPTIAGVAMGLLTPADPVDGRNIIEELEERIHPWSSYFVVPVFALANAGVHLGGGVLGRAAESRLTWAVAVGLFLGKIVGISGVSFLAIRSRLGRLPHDIDFGHIAGGAALGGIGFTVSLFIAGLAFSAEALQDEAKIGIMAGSLLSALVGSAILFFQRDESATGADPKKAGPQAAE